MMSADVLFTVRTALIYRPAVDRSQTQLVRELVHRIAGRVRRVYVDRFGPAVQEEESAHNGAEPAHGLKRESNKNCDERNE